MNDALRGMPVPNYHNAVPPSRRRRSIRQSAASKQILPGIRYHEWVRIQPIPFFSFAAGALITDLAAEFRSIHYAASDTFDRDGVNRILAELEGRCRDFMSTTKVPAADQSAAFTVEARYPGQVWEIEVPLTSRPLAVLG